MRVLTPGGYETRGANPLLPWGSTVPPPNSAAGGLAAGVAVNEQTVLQLAAAWGSVSLIADSIATLPVNQWRLVSGEARAMDQSQVIAEPWPEPLPGQGNRTFIHQSCYSLLFRGNAYGKIVGRDDDNPVLPTSVKLVHPDHASVRRNEKGQVLTRYWNQVVQPDDVTRAVGMTPPEGLVGLNPIEHFRNCFGYGRAMDMWLGAFFANSARPDGVIKVKGDLNDDEAKAMKAEWLSFHQGIAQSHLPAVLTGDADWQPITMNLVDAQFLELMGFSESVISGRIYRVPPHMIGMVDKDTSWGAGIEQQELGFVRNTLLIWLCRLEDWMTSWLPKGQFVTFDLSQRLRGDTLQRWQAWQIARVIGAMNNAEIRKVENLPKVTDPAQAAVLEAYDQPFNSSPVKANLSGGGGDKAN